MTAPGQLRRDLRVARRGLTTRQLRLYSQRMTRRLAGHPLFLRSRRVAGYLATDGEMDPGPLLHRARRYGKRCYLPVLRAYPRGTLWFVEFRDGDPLSPNRYGISEPSIRHRPPVPPRGLGLILVPLVAFDTDCNRLGMGGGFYDRTLSFRRQRRCWKRPLLVGLAHEFQRTTHLDARPWDVPLDYVATESGIYACRV